MSVDTLKIVQTFSLGIPERLTWRVFGSLLPNGLCVCRELTPFGETDIRRIQFSQDFKILSDTNLGIGEDPRIFEFQGIPYCLYWYYSGYNDWYHYLMNLQTLDTFQLKIEPWIFHGKNWVPVPYGNRLLILRSLQPLVVMELGIDGTCTVITGSSEEAIGEYRGGGNAIVIENKIVGYGHKTLWADCHTLFRYTINMTTWEIVFEDLTTEIPIDFRITDPTSMWENRLVVCATEYRWFDATQRTLNVILEIP